MLDFVRTENEACFNGSWFAGMHAWFAAVADPRITVVVPIIGVQVLPAHLNA